MSMYRNDNIMVIVESRSDFLVGACVCGGGGGGDQGRGGCYAVGDYDLLGEARREDSCKVRSHLLGKESLARNLPV